MLREITEQEWNEYEWIPVTGQLEQYENKTVFLRGRKKTSPPQDGYHYEESTTLADAEQKWARAMTFTEG